MKALFKFDNLQEFEDFYDERTVFRNWHIWEDDLKLRAKRIKNRSYFIDFQNQFNTNDIYKYTANSIEVVTWIDTLKMLHRVFFEFELNFVLGLHTTILMEYPIPYTGNKRIDYLIIKGDKMLVVECGMTYELKNLKKTYNRKLNEAIQYKELISNFTPTSTKVGVFTFVYLPEVDEEGYEIEEHVEKNEESCELFALFLTQFFSDKRVTEHVLSNVLTEWEFEE